MNEAQILEMTYFDTCTIKRKVKDKDVNTGVTSTIEKIIASNVKCAVSKNSNQIMTSDGTGKLDYTHSLFVNPNANILEGDTLEVFSMGKISIYLASKPFLYPSHAIVPITEKERV